MRFGTKPSSASYTGRYCSLFSIPGRRKETLVIHQKHRTTQRGGRRHSTHMARRAGMETSNVISLSNRPLSADETTVLEKGHSYMPSRNTDPFSTKIELFKFFRSIKLRTSFTKETGSIPFTQPSVTLNLRELIEKGHFRSKSSFMRPVSNPLVHTFCCLVDQDVSSLFTTTRDPTYPIKTTDYCTLSVLMILLLLNLQIRVVQWSHRIKTYTLWKF